MGMVGGGPGSNKGNGDGQQEQRHLALLQVRDLKMENQLLDKHFLRKHGPGASYGQK